MARLTRSRASCVDVATEVVFTLFNKACIGGRTFRSYGWGNVILEQLPVDQQREYLIKSSGAENQVIFFDICGNRTYQLRIITIYALNRTLLGTEKSSDAFGFVQINKGAVYLHYDEQNKNG